MSPGRSCHEHYVAVRRGTLDGSDRRHRCKRSRSSIRRQRPRYLRTDPWSQGGTTDLDRLAPLCETHHDLVHEGGWQLDVTPDRLGTWTRPDGVVFWTGSLIDRRPA
ncbi:MAG: hypothetical protein CL424_05640 [Acidimicrobiaceae bacterium]|nr:hypothetical protein [Acidimicrobiaceae bacterium]